MTIGEADVILKSQLTKSVLPARTTRQTFLQFLYINFTACGQTFNGTTSEINLITSYYSGYCNWEIHSPLVNSSVLLVVQRFQMQYCG